MMKDIFMPLSQILLYRWPLKVCQNACLQYSFPFKESEFEIIKTFDQSVEESLSKFTLGCKGYYTYGICFNGSC